MSEELDHATLVTALQNATTEFFSTMMAMEMTAPKPFSKATKSNRLTGS